MKIYKLSLEEHMEEPDFDGMCTSPQRINHSELNNLVHDLILSKNQAELLSSRLKCWHFFEKRSTISSYHRPVQDLQLLFSVEDN